MANIEFKIKVRRSYDVKTSCWIFYSKKYNISGYGKTIQEASKMFLVQVESILTPSPQNKLKLK
jgi:hypothetical protein